MGKVEEEVEVEVEDEYKNPDELTLNPTTV